MSWYELDSTGRSDNQDVVQLMRPVAAFTMLHCAVPIEPFVTDQRSRF